MIRILKFLLLKLKEKLYEFYHSFKVRLSKTYWQEKLRRIKKYDWNNAHPRDFLFVLTWARKMAFFLIKVFLIFFLIVYLGFLGRMPSRKTLREHQNQTASEVYSADSVLIGRYYIQDRTNIKYENVSPEIIKALIATEDVRFYKHIGIDIRSLGRVIIKSLLLKKESSGGGSTISQQLAKNLFPRRKYGPLTMPVNKLQEMIIAYRIESIFSKEEVLELYLNTVPLGGNLFGIERASLRFFNKPAKSVTTEEAAVLIGMLKATTTYNPRLNPEKAKLRRNVVLNQMVKYNHLSSEKAESLKKLPLTLKYNYRTHNEGLAPYFREQLRLELVKWCATKKKKNGETYNLYKDGLKIYTTIDSKLQLYAEQAVFRRMSLLQKQFDDHWKGQSPWGKNNSILRNAMIKSERYKKLKAVGATDDEINEIFRKPIPMVLSNYHGSRKRTISPLDSIRYYLKFLNTGLVSIEPKTGYVRAWVGGINHKFFKYDHVRSKRQVGSTFKPIVYAAALEKGIEPCTYFPNKLITYEEYDNWSPGNANNQYGGKYSMRGALANSVNTISAQLILQTGIKPTIELAGKMGIKTELPHVPALALGAANVSLFEMVTAYTTFANEGYRITPTYVTKIINARGKVIREEQPGFGKKVMSFQTSQLMLNLMQGVVDEGSAARLRSQFGLAMDIAGKTGTTQDQTDGWFIGITPDLITGVWVGGESPLVRFRTLALGQGSNTALPIWGDFMSRVIKNSDFRSYRSTSFPPMSPHLLDLLNCDSFIEEAEKKENFLDKLLDNIFSNGKSKEERKKEMEQKIREREQRWEAYRREKEKRKKERKERRKKRDWF